MADFALYRLWKLAERPIIAFWNEQRIIAKTATAARLGSAPTPAALWQLGIAPSLTIIV